MSGLTFIARPRIAADAFARVLATGASPAAPDAAALYAICAGHGLDPAVALAFFAHRSRYTARAAWPRARATGATSGAAGGPTRSRMASPITAPGPIVCAGAT